MPEQTEVERLAALLNKPPERVAESVINMLQRGVLVVRGKSAEEEIAALKARYGL